MIEDRSVQEVLGDCPECGADCIDSPSGVVCLNGHGGVDPVPGPSLVPGESPDGADTRCPKCGAGWVTAWAISQPELEGYGYTVEIQERAEAAEEKVQELEERAEAAEEKVQELEERAEAAEEKVQELEERLEDFHPAPRLTHLADSMKMEYFLEHFQEIPLEALEWFVREVRTK